MSFHVSDIQQVQQVLQAPQASHHITSHLDAHQQRPTRAPQLATSLIMLHDRRRPKQNSNPSGIKMMASGGCGRRHRPPTSIASIFCCCCCHGSGGGGGGAGRSITHLLFAPEGPICWVLGKVKGEVEFSRGLQTLFMWVPSTKVELG
ncbi:hypothetical protein VOLCADRAFT_98151 [Volvox carteri f. nagariensis]|uniref:Uncharacterized protein n=1 Tax=Volvox carteri f. nagariensis TaxID=3068 RepID=D8UEK7_VOLCA|nr:uncharacterized protein VOLCADRAFT_98151 [Volvox carteri f. nagariensis]EFJ41859.1 hypothetical protein VOLCADRAFT_98151 [Volvox carteri f. nagariensis]|eukprot:XP_002957057.1 hypothetical protein VOLCADRAFT_98151 [Volvox carteri f. nagariensis]